jgi:CTP:molybdopterin cytidylyltransferase MocA
VIDVAEPRPAAVLSTLIDAFGTRLPDIAAPTHNGARGTPIIAGEAALAALRNLRGGASLDALIARFDDVLDVPIDDGVVHVRIDSRESYQRAVQLLA